MKFISAIHGINTRLTCPSWPWRLQAHVANEGYLAAVQTEHYRAGPFPCYNTHIKNPLLAKSYANRLELIDPGNPISLVGHSNGADIAIRTAKKLAEMGRSVDTLVLIGAAVESCVAKSGLLELVESGHLGRAIAYSSADDPVTAGLELFAGNYGALGAKGFRLLDSLTGLILDGYEENPRGFPFVTRRFPGFGHSGYFDPARREETFETILSDLRVL